MTQQSEDLPARREYVQPVPFTDYRVEYDPDEADLRGHMAMLYRRRKLIVGIMAAVFFVGMLYTLTRRPIYESVAKILVFTEKPGMASSNADLPIIRNLEAITGSRSIDTQIEILSSPDLLDSAFKKLDPAIRREGFRQDAIPGWACKISQAKDADVIAVTGRAYTPEAAAALAKAVAAEYFIQDLQQSNKAVRQARIFAEGKMAKAETELSQANFDLSRFKRESGLFAPETQFMKQAERMADLSSAIDSVRAEISARRQENSALARTISAQQKDVVTGTTVTMNPQFSSALERIEKLRSDRAALLQEYRPDSRDVRAIEERIQREESRLKQIAATVVGSKVSARNPVRDTLLTQYSSGVAASAAASARLRSLETEARAREQTASKLPERERELTEHVRRISTLQRTYEMLSTRYHSLLLSEQSAIPSGILSSTPRIPGSAAYPKTASNAALFLLLGALAALAAVIITERLDVRVHDPSLVERMSGVAALSMVPEMPVTSSRLNGSNGSKPVLLESFRILRNNISFSGLSNGQKVLAITSPGRGEGKSTTAVNLAVTMAMDGNQVLLVDGDMRKRSLHEYLNIPGDIGLSTLLRKRGSIRSAIQKTSIENVDCIPAGPAIPNAAELLRSDVADELFRNLREWYDAVLIDCPPAAGLGDAQVISKLADGILLVVSISHTHKSHLETAIRMLGYTGVPILGLVVNRVDINPHHFGYYDSSYVDEEAA